MKEGVGCGQYGDDRILALFFGDQPSGVVVDVGAADGYMNSNSIGLLKRPEWCGVLIEPLPEHLAALRARYAGRDGVQIFATGIGTVHGTFPFHCGGQVSTFDADSKKAAEDVHKTQYKTINATIRTLTSVLDEARISEEIDFLSIDAEGMNYNVWLSLDQKRYRPRLISMEGRGHRMDGYYELCRCGGNTFYVRADQCKTL